MDLPHPDSLVTDPIRVFMILIGLVTAIIWANAQPRFARIAAIIPAPIWVYAIPIALSSMAIIPKESPAYSTMAALLVPVSLFLLIVSSDFRSTLKIGHLAAAALAAATASILVGGVVAYLALSNALPPESWKGFAVFAASWIGGSANMVATQQGLEAPPNVLGPLLIVDSAIGYGWIAFLLFLSGQKATLNKWLRVDQSRAANSKRSIDNVHVEEIERVATTREGLAGILFVGVAFSGMALAVAAALPELGDPIIVSTTTWGIMIIVMVAVIASFTRLRRLEAQGASDFGFILILTLLASLGARADFGAFLAAPVYLAAGIIWLSIHIAILSIVCRILRIPPVLYASASAANIGGFVTAPIVAAAYDRNLVPTALLMAAITQIAGIYLPFAFGTWLLSLGN